MNHQNNANNNLTPSMPWAQQSELAFTNEVDGYSPLLNLNNLSVQGGNIDQQPLVLPYGFVSLPPNNTKLCSINIAGSNSQPVTIGAINKFSADNPLVGVLQQGDSVQFSQSWGVRVSGSVQAYSFTNNTYSTTLPSGDWMNYLLLNRINELETIIAAINANYTALVTAFNAHVHSNSAGTTTGPTPTLTQTQITLPATLTQDTTYINNKNDLLGPNAQLVP